jgi:hypothetical protein
VTHQQGESIRTPQWRYSRWGDAGEELYDLTSDPGEFSNLAENSSSQPMLGKMRSLLEEARARSGGEVRSKSKRKK